MGYPKQPGQDADAHRRVTEKALDQARTIKQLQAALAAKDEEIAKLNEELSHAYIQWRCFDCGSAGPFKNVRHGNPIDGDYIETVCQKCKSENTGEPGENEEQRDEIARLRAERDNAEGE